MIPETRKKKKQKKKKQAPVTVVAFACYVSANCAVLVGRTGPGFCVPDQAQCGVHFHRHMSRLNCPAACAILRIQPQLEGPKTYKIAPYLRPARPMRRYAGSYAGLGVCGWDGHRPERSGCPRRPPRVDSHRAHRAAFFWQRAIPLFVAT